MSTMVYQSKVLGLYSKEQVEKAVSKAGNLAEALELIGLEANRGGYRKLHLLADHHGVSLPASRTRQIRKTSPRKPVLTFEEYFAPHTNRSGSDLRRRLIAEGVPYVCHNAACGIGPEWAGEPLVLQVDHKNGDHFDNSFSNLQFLCPNCHTQTETYGNKNAKRYSYCKCGRQKNINAQTCLTCYNKVGRAKVMWPPVDEVVAEVKLKGYVAYGAEIGVSDNSVRKYLIRNGVVELPKFR